MDFSDEQIQEFIQLYQTEYDIQLQKQDAIEKLHKLKELFRIMLTEES